MPPLLGQSRSITHKILATMKIIASILITAFLVSTATAGTLRDPEIVVAFEVEGESEDSLYTAFKVRSNYPQ